MYLCYIKIPSILYPGTVTFLVERVNVGYYTVHVSSAVATCWEEGRKEPPRACWEEGRKKCTCTGTITNQQKNAASTIG